MGMKRRNFERTDEKFTLRAGAVAPLLNGCQEYPLPEELKVGDWVTIISFDHGLEANLLC